MRPVRRSPVGLFRTAGIRLSVRGRLLGIVAVAGLAFATVGVVSALTAAEVGRTAAQEHRTVALQDQYQSTDVGLAKLRGQVYEVALASEESERREAAEEFAALQADFEELMVDTIRDTPEGPLLVAARAIHEGEEEFLSAATGIVGSASTTNPEVVAQALQALDDQAAAVDDLTDRLIVELGGLQERAIAETVSARASAVRTVVIASVAGVLLLIGLMLLVIRSILRGLGGVAAAAHRLAEGDFEARVEDGRDDEIGDLGSAFNATAESLRGMMRRLEEQGDQDAFGRELTEALDMADTEEGTFRVIGRSLGAVSVAHPAELLIADSSRAHLQVRAGHPDAGTPGCGVESPFGCVAVRRGTVTSFPDSRALNACGLLRDRGETPCSAVCAPVTFMGRALGVLHTTAPLSAPPDGREVARLTTLAAAAGSRLGTVRSFERTQLQASTDGLTGLMNRRSFETAARHLLQDQRTTAIVMADLDHFKLVNDTYGHETGDRTLQLFTEQLRSHLRSEDLLARYGGEEFALLLPGLSAVEAVEVLDRFRHRLAETTSLQPPVFTVSFGVTDTEAPDSLAGLIRRADAALYRAKALGRNCVVVDEMGPTSEHRIWSEHDMERAMIDDDPLDDLTRLR